MTVRTKGFSVIELMTVVGIMSILLAIAVPKYTNYIASAKQSEAKSTLYHIYTLLEAYFYDPGSVTPTLDPNYSTPDEASNFGFTPLGSPLYKYSFAVGTPPTAGAYIIEAKADKLCEGGGADRWSIDQDMVLDSLEDGSQCH
jgi:prepilin-type N-terminal cleavage/methylation domain-containing protein